MSYKATAWAYELPLKGPAKPVLTALADFADEAGSCYPGQDRIALMTGLSNATVRRALSRLESMGLLRREHRYDARGYRTSDRYYLSLDVQVLPVTTPTRQSAYKAESTGLPLTVQPPTAHSDRVTISRTTSDPSGGRGAPVPWCPKHPGGTERPCRACKTARTEFEALLATTPRQPKPIKHIPGLCDAHRQPEGTCEACEYERTHPERAFA